MGFAYSMLAAGQWQDERRANLLDGGTSYYDVYQCSDELWISIGSIEPQFYAYLRRRLGLNDPLFNDRDNRAQWRAQRAAYESLFRQQPRAHWCALLGDSDVCFAPVLSLTPGEIAGPAPLPGQDGDSILADWLA
ncbi:hypothetical protein BH10PSE12_BH10PSE12_22750 [soil metagenome]